VNVEGCLRHMKLAKGHLEYRCIGVGPVSIRYVRIGMRHHENPGASSVYSTST